MYGPPGGASSYGQPPPDAGGHGQPGKVPGQPPRHGEFGKVLADPTAAIDIAVGPPFPNLTPQQPGTGVIVGQQFDNKPRRFVFKKAHLSREDFRVFDYDQRRRVSFPRQEARVPVNACKMRSGCCNS
jgi:hypothetical protein